jgi:hypothetical protein
VCRDLLRSAAAWVSGVVAVAATRVRFCGYLVIVDREADRKGQIGYQAVASSISRSPSGDHLGRDSQTREQQRLGWRPH